MLAMIQTNYLRIRHGYVSLMGELWLELMRMTLILVKLKKRAVKKPLN
nr:MAG TPA: hypothetical protein [Caudoviricetes sp.]